MSVSAHACVSALACVLACMGMCVGTSSQILTRNVMRSQTRVPAGCMAPWQTPTHAFTQNSKTLSIACSHGAACVAHTHTYTNVQLFTRARTVHSCYYIIIKITLSTRVVSAGCTRTREGDNVCTNGTHSTHGTHTRTHARTHAHAHAHTPASGPCSLHGGRCISIDGGSIDGGFTATKPVHMHA